MTPDNYFDAAAALYWYAVDYHSGQWSELYALSCTLGYRPGMSERSPGPSDSDTAPEFYAALERGEWDPSELRDAINAVMESNDKG